MGRKKGKQAGNFQSKSEHAVYRHTQYVDRASEANRYRNPTTSSDLGRGHGYRNAYHDAVGGGYGYGYGCGGGGGDKWSSIFSSSSSSSSAPNNSSTTTTTASSSRSRRAISSVVVGPDNYYGTGYNNVNRAAMGLSRLRFLLEERRSEDRVHDRQHRLRLQRSRWMNARNNDGTVSSSSSSMMSNNNNKNTTTKKQKSMANDRHEPGWLLSHSTTDDNESSSSSSSSSSSGENHRSEEVDHGWKQKYDDALLSTSSLYNAIQGNSRSNSSSMESKNNDGRIPSLQKMATRVLGPLLPMYCAACGSDFVGESLKSVSVQVLSDLAIALAASNNNNGDYWSSSANTNNGRCDDDDDDDGTFATTDGAVKALVRSGTATGLVVRGAPLLLPVRGGDGANDNGREEEEDYGDDDDDDMRWLSDDGLLSLCPRIRDDTSNIASSGIVDGCNGNDDDGTANNESPYDDDDDDDIDGDEDHWETLDFDTGLNSRMAGCFHLKRLELIDVPLRRRRRQQQQQQHGSSSPSWSYSSGISLGALRTVLRSCSNITHLSLSGCFYNWEEEKENDDVVAMIMESKEEEDDDNDIGMLLCGNPSVSDLTRSFAMLGERKKEEKEKRRRRSRHCGDDDGNGANSNNNNNNNNNNGEEDAIPDLIPQLLFHQIFREDDINTANNDIAGLDSLLPELRVLDVSHCSWVFVPMVVQFLLRSWGRAAFVSTADDCSDGGGGGVCGGGGGGGSTSYESSWGDDADERNNGIDSIDGSGRQNHHHHHRPVVGNQTGGSSRNHHHHHRREYRAEINIPLRHLNIRGCTGLLVPSSSSSSSSASPTWMEQWREHGLFDGIDVSTHRQARKKR